MKRFLRLIRRKRNLRRLMAGAFLIAFFVEIGSHAFIDSYDADHFETLGFCGIQHEAPTAVDVPADHKRRGPESNLMDEMTIHAVILNDLTSPRCGISYWTSEDFEAVIQPLSGSLSPPFHPPKQA
jgi:hypothetical protein